MTAAEKRYFKRHYASDASLLTTLFDYINRMKSYDEEVVKNHFANSKLAKNLKVYKVQLADLLLKSLVSYHSKSSIHSKIRIGLEEIDLLIKKQLFDIALTKVNKLKSLCTAFEAYEYLFPILAFELSLNSFYSANRSTRIENSTFREFERAINSVQEVFALQRESHRLSDIKNHLSTKALSTVQKDDYKTLMAQLLKKSNKDSPFREQYYRYHILSMISRLIWNDPIKEHNFKTKQIDLFEEKASIAKAYPSLYFASMYNYLSSCWKIRDFQALEKGIQDIQLFIKNNVSLEPNMLFVFYLQILVLFSKDLSALKGDFEERVLAHIKRYGQQRDFLAGLIYLRLAIIHLCFDRHKMVQFYIRRIQQNIPTSNESFNSLITIIELISHYQSDDLFLVNNMITAQIRKQNKNNVEQSKLFKSILSFFQKLTKAKGKQQISHLAEQFTIHLEGLEHKQTSLFSWLNEYLFYDWIEMLRILDSANGHKTNLLHFVQK